MSKNIIYNIHDRVNLIHLWFFNCIDKFVNCLLHFQHLILFSKHTNYSILYIQNQPVQIYHLFICSLLCSTLYRQSGINMIHAWLTHKHTSNQLFCVLRFQVHSIVTNYHFSNFRQYYRIFLFDFADNQLWLFTQVFFYFNLFVYFSNLKFLFPIFLF